MNTPFLKMTQGDKRKLAISEMIIIGLAIIGLAVVVWIAWLRPDPKAITTFKECSAAGYPVHASYPEVCVTPSGKQFVNPAQRVQLPPNSTPTAANNSDKAPANSDKELTFAEWKVELPYPSGVTKLSATKADDDTFKINLDDVNGDCKGTNTLRRAMADGDLDGYAHTPAQVQKQLGTDHVKKIGSYYYVFIQGTATCTDNVAIQKQINALNPNFTGNKIQNLVAQ